MARWGIVGTGGIAASFVGDLQLTGHDVAAVGSRTAENAERFAARFGIDRAHGSYRDLADDPEVDVVYVATPHPSHHRDARLALEAGKHVLVEKPFTINAAEAREVYELAAERGLVALEAMWTRWLPHMVELRRIVAEGQIGDPRTLTADFSQILSADPTHRLNALELGGGSLLDIGVYLVSLASDVFGAAQSVQARARFRPTGADAQVAMTLGYAGDRMASLLCASDLPGPNRAVLLGSAGWIEVEPTWWTPSSLRVFNGAGEQISSFVEEIAGRGMQFQAAEMERLIDEGRESEVLPVAESIAVMETLDQIRAEIGLRYPSE